MTSVQSVRLWEFTEKIKELCDMKKKNKFKLYFGVFCVLAFFGWVMQLLGLAPKTETPTVPSVTVETSSSSKEEKTEQSSTTETSSSSQEIKNDGPEYDKAANAEFANHFLTELNNMLSETGIQVNVEYYDKGLVYVYLPQDAKYLSTVEIQEIADTILGAKEKIFTDWAIDNGFDLGFTNSPTLHLKAEDGTTLAEENNFNETMTVKVKN